MEMHIKFKINKNSNTKFSAIYRASPTKTVGQSMPSVVSNGVIDSRKGVGEDNLLHIYVLVY